MVLLHTFMSLNFLKSHNYIPSAIFFMLLISISPAANTQTVITSGAVSGTWTKANSPYYIRGTVQIVSGTSLTIEPGVTIDFRGKYKIIVKGALKAVGTQTDSIRFTTSVAQFEVPPPVPPANDSSHWLGIEYEDIPALNDSTLFRFCRFEYAHGTMSLPAYTLSIKYTSKIAISNCTFTNCESQYGGGSISIYYASPRITHNIFAFNSGNSIYAGMGCYSHIANNIIANNKGSNAGALIIEWSSPVVYNNIIANNTMQGGTVSPAVTIRSNGTPVFFNNTIVNNHSINKGGAFYFDNTNAAHNPTIKNCIVWGNTAANGGNQVYLEGEENDPNFYNCNIQGGTAAFEMNSTIYTGTYLDNIDSLPLFVKPTSASGSDYVALGDSANWALLPQSSCIDKGKRNENYPDYDVAGNPRVTVCRIDMGAYEYQSGIPMLVQFNVTQPIICNGDTTGALSASVSGGTGPFTYLWNTGSTGNTLQNLGADTFVLTVSSSSNGCVITKSFILTQPEKMIVDAGRDTALTCHAILNLDSVKVNQSASGMRYKWLPGQGISNDTLPNPGITFLKTTDYVVRVTSPAGCVAFDTIKTSIKPYAPQQICVVSVNESNKNQLVWNKVQGFIDTFYVLKEITTNQYSRISAWAFDSLSTFIDVNSNPDAQSNKYRMEMLDKCGVLSNPSVPHKTIHLSINKGTGTTWNLIWENYEGITPTSYNILRGTSTGNMSVIGTSSASNTQFSDVNAPSGNLVYQIEMFTPQTCFISKNFNSTRSNVKHTASFGAAEQLQMLNSILIFPNPASYKLNIEQLSINNGRVLFTLYSITGLVVKQTEVSSSSHLDVSDLNNGMYLAELKSDHGFVTRKVVIQR